MKRWISISMLCLALAGCWRQQGTGSSPGKGTIALGVAIVVVIGGIVFLKNCTRIEGDPSLFGLCERT